MSGGGGGTFDVIGGGGGAIVLSGGGGGGWTEVEGGGGGDCGLGIGSTGGAGMVMSWWPFTIVLAIRASESMPALRAGRMDVGMVGGEAGRISWDRRPTRGYRSSLQ